MHMDIALALVDSHEHACMDTDGRCVIGRYCSWQGVSPTWVFKWGHAPQRRVRVKRDVDASHVRWIEDVQ